jgi:hypothetical protein
VVGRGEERLRLLGWDAATMRRRRRRRLLLLLYTAGIGVGGEQRATASRGGWMDG